MAKNFTVEPSDRVLEWLITLPNAWQDEIDAIFTVLEKMGPAIPRQYSKPVEGSAYGHMCELRIQCQGHPIRILYAFDPNRVAFLLIGGDKTGDDRWYKKNIPKADKFYKAHLDSLEERAGNEKNDEQHGKIPGHNDPGKKRKEQTSG